MILSADKIKEAVENGSIKISDFSDEQIQPASYDLRVGGQGITTSSPQVVNIDQTGFIELLPGEFATIMVHETISFDASHTGRIGLRSGYSRKGLVAAIGPQVDPGYHGKLKIGIVNLSAHKIVLPYLDDLLTLEIHQLPNPSTIVYTGPYQGESKLTGDDIQNVKEGENMGFGTIIKTLSELSMSVAQLTKSTVETEHSLRSLATQNRAILWIGGFFATVMTIMLAIIALK